MSKLYLFSPVGNTDPIKYQKDGSLLHICRVYKPDVVYLYLSKEIYAHHLEDNRYIKTLQLLGEKLDHKFEIHTIVRKDLVEVQQYDFFYQEFREQIAEIEKMMLPGDQLLLNMASGTPAMKSALVVMATLAEYRFVPIQVKTPKNGSNLEFEERDFYDVEENWERDADNQSEFENRCYEVRCMNLLRMLKLDIIKNHLLAYDYRAALNVSKDLNPRLNTRTQNLLKAADARLNLDWKTLRKYSLDNMPEFGTTKNLSQKNIFEYVLGLDIKLKKGEFADFVRGITPVVADLLEIYLDVKCNIKIDDYCYYNKKNVRNWDYQKMRNNTAIYLSLTEKFKEFKFGMVSSIHLNAIIQKIGRNKQLNNLCQRLTDVEQNIRNIAAHEIVSVTESWIRQKVQFSAQEILNTIKILCNELKICENRADWDSYDKMNHFLLQALDADQQYL